jgi:superfamily II DNA or RNA helicase
MSGQLSLFGRRPSPLELLIEESTSDQDPDGLRYYQRDCYDSIFRVLKRVRAALIVMATGLGKTQEFCAVAKHWDGDVLILAHRDELIEQARARVERMTGEFVELEQGPFFSSRKTRIVVGSVQSLHAKRLKRLGPDRFSLIIIDEAHHATAPSYQRILDFFHGARVLGVTATPDRSDEKALGKVFDEVAYVFDISEGIEAGYLVPFGICRTIDVKGWNLDTIKKTAGDLAAGALDKAMLSHIAGIVEKTLELEPDRTAICFFPGVASAELAAKLFNEVRPGSAEFVSGMTDEDVRKDIVKRFKKGEFKYLCNCMVFTEGFDAPNADMVVLGRPTLSRSLHAQMLGRGTRVLDGVVDGIEGKAAAGMRRVKIAESRKPNLVVLDFVGNSKKHNLATVVDVLGGNYTDAEVKQAKKIAKGGAKPAEALEQAREQLRAMAQAVTAAKAKVEAEVSAFDPFAVLGVDIGAEERFEGKFGGAPATPGQLAALAKFGIEQKDLNQLSKQAASRLFEKCKGRMAHGLCSYRQLRQLQRFGVTQKNVPFSRAVAALDYIKSKGWGDREPVDHAVVQDIIHHRRAAGEEG